MVRHERRLGVTGGLCVVEISRGIGLQAHGELMEVLRDLVIAIEALIEIRLPVAIEIAQFHNLIAASDVDDIVDDFESERLIEPGSDATPGLLRAGEAFHKPHITHPGAEG